MLPGPGHMIQGTHPHCVVFRTLGRVGLFGNCKERTASEPGQALQPVGDGGVEPRGVVGTAGGRRKAPRWEARKEIGMVTYRDYAGSPSLWPPPPVAAGVPGPTPSQPSS